MKLKTISLCIIIFSFISCKNETQKVNSTTTEVEEISLLDTLSLKLNQGEKWIVNPETHVGIKNMDSIIEVFNSNSNKDYLALGKDLSKQTGYVIKNCSMKGEPHEQLHVVLVPMLEEIYILKDSNDIKETEAAVKRLETLIKSYFTHFKL